MPFLSCWTCDSWGVGLDAFVHCRCAFEGVASDPPVPFQLTEEGIVCDGTLPLEDLLLFDQWLELGCVHGSVHHSVRIANWSGYREFQQSLRRVGSSNFPVLSSELPEANGGQTSSRSAAEALKELQTFERSSVRWLTFVLVDGATNEVVAERIEPYDGVFIYNGSEGWRAGLTSSGTFLVVEDSDAADNILFEAASFTEAYDQGDSWVWTGPDGQEFRTESPLRVRDSKTPNSGATEFEVRESLRGPEHSRHVVASLQEIFAASVEIDMPVHWA